MCIIVAKPAGIDLPSEDILDNCFASNRDGIGFAFNKPGDNPIIVKGFANVKKLIKMWDTFNIKKEHNLLLHFRLATHGMKDQGNCHPFPLTNSLEDMRTLHCACDTAITHNGVFGQMNKSEKYSDTMKFVSNILASPEIISNLNTKPVVELIRGYCGFSSKLAFLRADGLSLIGDFEKDEGISYSNTQYKGWGNRWSHITPNEWCSKHMKYDSCAKEERALGKTWCYVHKDYDLCEYCDEHRIMDDCAQKARNCCGSQDVLDLRIFTCEECGTKADVLYNKDLLANLCPCCSVLYATEHK